MSAAAAGLPLPLFEDGALTLLSPRLLAARFEREKRALSDAAWNGGWTERARAVANHQMHPGAFDSAASRSRYCRSLLAEQRLPPSTALLLTAAPVAAGGLWQSAVGASRITIAVSAGVRRNAVWAGDPASYEEVAEDEYAPLPAGTINAMVFVEARLAEAVFPHIFTVVAEAKTDVLRARGVPSCYSGRRATGTGTDSTVVVADPLGRRGFATASTHSALGAAIAQGMRSALADALRADGIFCPDSHEAPHEEADDQK